MDGWFSVECCTKGQLESIPGPLIQARCRKKKTRLSVRQLSPHANSPGTACRRSLYSRNRGNLVYAHGDSEPTAAGHVGDILILRRTVRYDTIIAEFGCAMGDPERRRRQDTGAGRVIPRRIEGQHKVMSCCMKKANLLKGQ